MYVEVGCRNAGNVWNMPQRLYFNNTAGAHAKLLRWFRRNPSAAALIGRDEQGAQSKTNVLPTWTESRHHILRVFNAASESHCHGRSTRIARQ